MISPELKVLDVQSKMKAMAGDSDIQRQAMELRLKTIDAMRDRHIHRPIPSASSGYLAASIEKLSGSYVIPKTVRKGFSGKHYSLRILESISLESDDLLWWHLSISRDDLKMPTYSDLEMVRKMFLGDRWSIQYFPPADQYVNDHHACLHLWHCLESNPLPDFRKFGTI